MKQENPNFVKSGRQCWALHIKIKVLLILWLIHAAQQHRDNNAEENALLQSICTCIVIMTQVHNNILRHNFGYVTTANTVRCDLRTCPHRGTPVFRGAQFRNRCDRQYNAAWPFRREPSADRTGLCRLPLQQQALIHHLHSWHVSLVTLWLITGTAYTLLY